MSDSSQIPQAPRSGDSDAVSPSRGWTLPPQTLPPQTLPPTRPGLPEAQGLYDASREHDACGVGFVAHIKGKKSHAIVEQGLLILKNLTHRGAVGADPKASDGAGVPALRAPRRGGVDRSRGDEGDRTGVSRPLHER